jgi:ATP-dependent RNA helicase RhlE
MLQRLSGERRGTTRALILTPTRELAGQIQDHTRRLGRYTRLSSAAIFGGVGMGPQTLALRSGVDILVATPGRLLDHLRQGHARLNGVQLLVLDEADRMLDMGFLPDVRRILRQLPTQRQTLLFSATLPPPIVELTRDMLRQPVSIDLAEGGKTPAAGIAHSVYRVPAERKPALLLELLRRGDLRSAIAFTRTKHRANRLADYLERHGVAATRLHGGRSQSQREQALGGFKAGRFNVLVATNIAARGIDVSALSHVVNFDVPNCPEDYVHRVGRTARAEATGDALVFVSAEEETCLRDIERSIGQRFPRLTLPSLEPTSEATPSAARPWVPAARQHARRGGRMARV